MWVHHAPVVIKVVGTSRYREIERIAMTMKVYSIHTTVELIDEVPLFVGLRCVPRPDEGRMIPQ